MKWLLPWLVAVAALGGTFYFYKSGKAKSDELASVQPALQELETLRAENEELKTNRVSVQEVERLRQDNADLLRLRNEVQQLRHEKQQLTQQAATAQASAQQAQAQAQAAQLQARAMATNVPPATQLSPEMMEAFRRRYGLDRSGAQPVQPAQTFGCINNLRMLDGAKQQWALENRKTPAAVPTEQDIAPYLKGNVLPKCPNGGVYTLNSVASLPTCSLAGHALPQ
jgi:multidrug efflux pump subunit AcrA (membrane-fusion protein)